MRNNIILECRQTSERIYITSKNKRNTPERLRLMKYSPKLQKEQNLSKLVNSWKENEWNQNYY